MHVRSGRPRHLMQRHKKLHVKMHVRSEKPRNFLQMPRKPICQNKCRSGQDRPRIRKEIHID